MYVYWYVYSRETQQNKASPLTLQKLRACQVRVKRGFYFKVVKNIKIKQLTKVRMKKLTIVLAMIMISCVNEKSIELLETEEFKTEYSERRNSRSKTKEVDLNIPFMASSFSYTTTGKEKIINLSGSLLEITTSDPLSINHNPGDSNLTINNNSTDTLTIFLNQGTEYKSNVDIITFFLTRKVYIDPNGSVDVKKKRGVYYLTVKN